MAVWLDGRVSGRDALAHQRGRRGCILGEVIATLGPIRSTRSTSSTNLAISIGRMFSSTLAGVAPASVPAFIVRRSAA